MNKATSREGPKIPRPAPALAGLAPFKQGKSTLKGSADPIKLSANESHLGPSEQAIKAYHAVAKRLFRYPDGGQTILRQAIGETFGLNPRQIICGNGSDELLLLLVRAYVRPGDDVVFSRYSFAMAHVHATAQGANVITAEEPGLRPDADAILAALTPKTRMVILASPNNPVGQYIARDELWRLYNALPRDVLLVIDAAYGDYVDAPDYEPGAALVDAGPNAVMTRTFSKLYGLSALRIGWAYMPDNVVDAIERIRTPFNTSSAAMAAAGAAVRDTDYAHYVRNYNRTQLDHIRKTIEAMNCAITFVPSVANFYLLRFEGPGHSPEGAAAALERAGIIPRPVAAGGPADCLRITVGRRRENDAVLKVVRDYMQG